MIQTETEMETEVLAHTRLGSVIVVAAHTELSKPKNIEVKTQSSHFFKTKPRLDRKSFL